MKWPCGHHLSRRWRRFRRVESGIVPVFVSRTHHVSRIIPVFVSRTHHISWLVLPLTLHPSAVLRECHDESAQINYFVNSKSELRRHFVCEQMGFVFFVIPEKKLSFFCIKSYVSKSVDPTAKNGLIKPIKPTIMFFPHSQNTLPFDTYTNK